MMGKARGKEEEEEVNIKLNTHEMHGSLYKPYISVNVKCQNRSTIKQFYAVPIYTIILLNVCLSMFAILARSSREMSLTVRIDRQYILSQVRVSVRPRILLYVKNIQHLGEIGPPVPVFISMANDRHCRQRSGPSRLGANPIE